jgi:hypothetical protein
MKKDFYGIIATFDTSPEIYKASKQVNQAGYTKFEVYTPFPVHGIENVMGEKRSVLGGFSLIGGIIGFLTGIATVAYMNYNYPLIVGGKVIFGPVFPFPIFYELTILLAAFGTLGGMFFLNNLPRLNHPIFEYDDFGKSSDDKFMIFIESEDPKYSTAKTKAFLEKLGGYNVTLIPFAQKNLKPSYS